MRKIEFPAGMRPNTKLRVSTLAWATNRRGRNTWTHANVYTAITEYVNAAGFAYSPTDCKMAIKWLVDNKYGWTERSEGGKRTLKFNFHRDVDLSGHMPLGPRLQQASSIGNGDDEEVTKAGVEKLTALTNTAPAPVMVTQAVDPIPAPAPPNIDIPLPGPEIIEPLYMLAKFEELARKWADVNPDGWARWVEAAISNLATQVGG